MESKKESLNKYINKLNKYDKYNKFKNINYTSFNNLKLKNNESTFNLLFQNISTLKGKINEIEIFLDNVENHFDIVAFCETKKVTDTLINKFRNKWNIEYVEPKLNKCGGIILFINKNIQYNILKI
jgi:hypothetical protein